jgi:predicted secreted protein
MAVSDAGYKGTVGYAATSAGPFTEIDGIRDATLSYEGDILDTSNLKDKTGWRTKIVGLKSGTLSVDGHFLGTDTEQDAIRAAFIAGTSIGIEVLPDATNGYAGTYVLSAFDTGTPLEDVTPFSFTAELSGAPVAVP